jgi:hypothetical protein
MVVITWVIPGGANKRVGGWDGPNSEANQDQNRGGSEVPDRAHLNSSFACSASQSISEARIYRRFWYVTAITNRRFWPNALDTPNLLARGSSSTWRERQTARKYCVTALAGITNLELGQRAS